MKTILITGGSRGIGYSTSEKCLKEGSRVILLSNDLKGLEKAKKSLMEKGYGEDRVSICCADLSQVDKLPALVESISWIHEGLDGLVNNAAVEFLGKTESYSIHDMEQTLRVNIMAPIILIQLCWKALIKNQGSVVNVGSISDSRYHDIYAFYGGSKAFLKSFTKHLACELGFKGVKVTMVTPGGIQTPLMDEISTKHFSKEDVEAALQTIPMEQRWGTSDEIAETIWFALFGPRYFHGDEIRVHGGLAC